MAITLNNKPISKVGPAGQDWYWAVTSTNSSQPKFKYVIDLYIFNAAVAGTPTVRLKIQPNAFTIGNFNLKHILQQYVVAERGASRNSTGIASFKGVPMQWDFFGTMFHLPIHLIDEWSVSTDGIKRFKIKIGEEYAATSDDPAVVYPNLHTEGGYMCFNGVVPNNAQVGTDSLFGNTGGVVLDSSQNVKYGGPFIKSSGFVLPYFLSNAPVVQYVGPNDYMTVAALAGKMSGYTVAGWDRMQITINSVTIDILADGNGGHDMSTDGSLNHANRHLQYFGCGPANLKNNATFNTHYTTNGVRDYQIVLANSSGLEGVRYNFITRDDDCKGYETIRLCWLNRHGTWDYYNFTKKSYRKLSIDREYTQNMKSNNLLTPIQLPHSRVNGTFSVRAKETITANTDWVNDEEAIWLEELFTSPEVFMLKGFQTTDIGANGPGTQYDYVRPVQIVNNSYERYTRANDKVAQYEIEIEVDDVVNVQGGQSSNGILV